MIYAAVIFALFSGSDQEPVSFVLETENPVWDVTVGDVTGDGHPDILALLVDDESEPPQKKLSIFPGDAAAKFRKKASAEIDLPWGGGTLLLAQTDRSAALEVLLAGHDGVRIFAWNGSTIEEGRHVEFATLLPSGTHEPIFLRDVVYDLDDDGIDEWLFPIPEGFVIAGPEGVRKKLAFDLTSEMRFFGRHLISHELPVLKTFPQADSPVLGIAALTDRAANFFYGDAWEKHETYRIPKALEDKWDSDTVMDDINADGFPDIVVSQTQGTTKVKVKTRVYIAERPFVYPEEPTAEFEAKGAFTVPALRDVNGDEKLDLVFLGVSIGVRNILNYFVRGKVSVNIDAHLFKDGKYPRAGHLDTHLTMEAPEGREQLAYVMGDFTGDDRLDALVAVKRNRLSLFEGHEKDVVRRKATHSFALPAFGVARRCDLDGDNRDDVVLFHHQNGQQKRIEVLIF